MKIRILGFFFLSVFIIVSVTAACKKEAAEPAEEATAEKVTMVKEGLNEFEGTVKLAYGSYLYVPEIIGFDIVLPAGQSTSELEGKAVRVRGEFNREKPSILLATSIDVREASGAYRNFFTKTGEEAMPDFLNQHERDSFPVLQITALNKADAWEGKGKGKVFGRLEKQTVTEGGTQKDVYRIPVEDDKGKLIGKVIVDNISEFAAYYIKKLRLFDSFWLYLNIKNSVDLRTRTRTQELFHADIVYAGLF